VEARSGRVVVVESLDHELERTHRLIIAARYDSMMSLCVVNVNVVDENDNAPKFVRNVYVELYRVLGVLSTIVLGIKRTYPLLLQLDMK
jgi:hypothetical protein